MATPYRVVDRSILLPHYKRWLVDPLVRHVPAHVTPNAITHLGHVTSLGAATIVLATHGATWGFFVALVLLQVYCWADNADGAHARRTQQSSEWGELLDHGLDQLTTLYVALIVCAVFDMPPIGWVLVPIASSMAAALTYWEQTRTGVMHLGLANQVEAMCVMSIALVATALYGRGLWSFAVVGVSLRTLMLVWIFGSIAFGALRGITRVRAAAGTKVAVSASLPLLGVGAIGLAAIGSTPPQALLLAGSAATTYWGIHMLAVRFGRSERASHVLFVLAAVTFGVLALPGLSPLIGWIASAAIAALFITATIADIAIVRTRLGGPRA